MQFRPERYRQNIDLRYGCTHKDRETQSFLVVLLFICLRVIINEGYDYCRPRHTHFAMRLDVNGFLTF